MHLIYDAYARSTQGAFTLSYKGPQFDSYNMTTNKMYKGL